MIPEGAIARLVQAMEFLLLDENGDVRGWWRKIDGLWQFLPYTGWALSTEYPPAPGFPDTWQPTNQPPPGINWIAGSIGGGDLRGLLLVGPQGASGPDLNGSERVAMLSLTETAPASLPTASQAILVAGSTVGTRPQAGVAAAAYDTSAEVALTAQMAGAACGVAARPDHVLLSGRAISTVQGVAYLPNVSFRHDWEVPWLEFRSLDGTTQYARLAAQTTAAELEAAQDLFLSAGAAGEMTFRAGAFTPMIVRNAGYVDLSEFRAARQSRVIAGDSTQALLVGSSAGAGAASAGFYRSATSSDAIGARSALIESNASGLLLLADSGAMTFHTGGADRVSIGAAGHVGFGGGFQWDPNGLLRLTRTGETVRHIGNNAFTSWYQTGGGTRIGYIQGNASELLIVGESVVRLLTNGGALLFSPGNVERMRLLAGGLIIGKNVSQLNTAGLELQTNGSIWSTVGTAGIGNLVSNRVGAANVNGQVHVGFFHAGTLTGSITRASSTTVSYGTGSDRDLKQDFQDLDPATAAEILRLVIPQWFRWIGDPAGDLVAGYVAQDVARLWPGSIAHGLVIPGEGTRAEHEAWLPVQAEQTRRAEIVARILDRNARLPDDSPAKWTEPQQVQWVLDPWRPWQMDMSKWTPIIHAGWLHTDARVTAVEARLARLEALQSGA